MKSTETEEEKTTLHEGEVPSDETPRRAEARSKMACLVALNGELRGTRFDLDRPVIGLGRGRGMEIRLAGDDFVSRHHAEILVVDGMYEIQDCGSTNGSYVNSKRIGRARLSDGDRIQIGTNVFKFLHAGDLENAWLDEMYRLATRDPLTELFNKHYLLEQMDAKLSASARYRESLAVLLMDIDHFKKTNDGFGHVAGDAVLRGVAGRMQKLIRQEDVLARFGGEEFVLLAFKASADTARALAERIRTEIADSPFETSDRAISVTLSTGIYVVEPGERLTTETALKRADHAMYRAKEEGRNRVCVWSANGSS